MNKKALIIFLVVITVFVSYFLVTKSKEQKLCEEYGGEWLSKDIWDISTDTCEFIYLSFYDISSYGTVYYKYFDGDEPNEKFYLQSEENQRRAIESKKLISFLGEDITESKNLISSLGEKYKKEISIAKKYCEEVRGNFGQYTTNYKSRIGHAREDIIRHHWVVRCYIK